MLEEKKQRCLGDCQPGVDIFRWSLRRWWSQVADWTQEKRNGGKWER